MFVTEKGQVTIPKLIRTAAGVLPGSEVAFSLEAGNIVISKVSSGMKTDRRVKRRAAGAMVRKSTSPEFRQMSEATAGKKRGGRQAGVLRRQRRLHRRQQRLDQMHGRCEPVE